MAIDDEHLALMALTNKNAALDRATTELKNNLNGDFDHDAPIQVQLTAIHDEQIQISSRMAAIGAGQPFTPPTVDEVNALGDAISTLDRDIKASAAVNSIIGDVTTLLKQYGAKQSA